MWHVENELLSQPEISLVLMAWDIQWRVLSSSSPPPYFSISLPSSISLCLHKHTTAVMNKIIDRLLLLNYTKICIYPYNS